MPMAHPSGGGSPADRNVAPDTDERPRAEHVDDVGGSPIGEERLGRRSEVEANTLGIRTALRLRSR